MSGCVGGCKTHFSDQLLDKIKIFDFCQADQKYQYMTEAIACQRCEDDGRQS